MPHNLDDAETELRAALDSGDPERIGHAARAVDQQEKGAASVPLIAAALWYVEQGLRVFPLQPGTKIPLKGGRGCLDATNDPDQVRAWWERTPEANIGLATGHLVDVVDVDGREGQRTRAAYWAEVFERIDADSLAKVLTPSPGGMHIYVPAREDAKNGANLAPSVDFRAGGGYVVAPPSVTPAGRYKFLGDATALTRLVEEKV